MKHMRSKRRRNRSASSPGVFLFFFLALHSFPEKLLAQDQSCKSTCGNIHVQYPFGTGSGCGDLRFAPYLCCDEDKQQLLLTTHSGSYPVLSIDYQNNLLYIQDPSMSTCSCTRPSGGFGLDWDAPFTFADSTVFVLLDCDTSSSPVYNTSELVSGLCDPGSSSICSALYLCPAVAGIGSPVSTCCIYSPVNLGPAFDMDLRKLNCNSYAAVYGFDAQRSDPGSWRYGVALKYRFNVENDYPEMCRSCERSNGACAFGVGTYHSFACSCPNGVNTSTDCFFPGWSTGATLKSWFFPPGAWWTLSVATVMALLERKL
ncbi:uncharacterized protein LOC18432578 [Amborella trichopoda]|uniref:Wall-associated receptor kinase galacturonan-binding domain-containing protein n=1 Tax=Amborella trichopoda TaxID=13333 RepID=W1P9Q5_AMBTC|nr:uncharacterized protein LOC18432578 [Amborella trichopoda]ERN04419.1 hypothetical protein AMTR_s00133p00056380 [Amborella trichopoda]|eukprot:XP_020521907.1 uncharacterized protein LOC18432578 [Amborella trichopoda]